MIASLVAGMVLIFSVPSTAYGMIVIDYSDRPSWEAAVGGSFSVEDFADATLEPGFTGFTSTNGVIAGGIWDDQLFGGDSSEFDFAPQIYAWGADFDMSPAGPGSGVFVELMDGSLHQVGFLPGNTNGFFGILTTEPFVKVVLSTTAGGLETFDMDDMTWSTAKFVSGEFSPIDSTALVLAGLQTSAIWMLPVLAGAAGVGTFYIKSRISKD